MWLPLALLLRHAEMWLESPEIGELPSLISPNEFAQTCTHVQQTATNLDNDINPPSASSISRTCQSLTECSMHYQQEALAGKVGVRCLTEPFFDPVIYDPSLLDVDFCHC